MQSGLRLAVVAIVLAVFEVSCVSAVKIEYSVTQKVDQVDVYHGIEVEDAYRWLEDDVRESEKVSNWIKSQNEVTFGYLRSISERDAIKSRITELWDYDKYSIPYKAGGRYYISRKNGLQNHYVTYMMDTLDGKRKVLLDPNKWSKDGTVAMGGKSFSDDGKYVAYAVQKSGSDWRTWKVREITTGKDIPDVLEYLKFTQLAWDAESKGFFYGKYPTPEPGKEFMSLNTDMKVMYHRLGTSQDDDVLIYYRSDQPEWSYDLQVTDDGQYLIMTISVSTDSKYRVIYKDLQQPFAMGIDLVTEFENEYSFIDNDGTVFYFLTDLDAPNKRVIAIDISKPKRKDWKEIIPEADESLSSVNRVNNTFTCSYLKDVTSRIKLYGMDGRYLKDVELPGVGTAGGFGGKNEYTETFYSFQSLTVPPSIYRFDMLTGKSDLLERPKIDFDQDDYVTEQVFYNSKDGTRIPMFIGYKKGMKRDGSNPVLLSGYGGFDISIRPRFSISNLVWMEMGGVCAVANIRGGSEYGQKWHIAGKKMNKQNVFDDFITAGEYLIKAKYTNSKKLAIVGGSNGGLLVGACITQRPKLYGAAIPIVGVMDMLRYNKFTAGRFWVDEYGSAAESKEMFEYLLNYSPYHSLKQGTHYPSTLVITADTDDRVVPGHSFKFAARLQECHSGSNPVLIRIATSAGHGSGKPTSMVIEEQADIYAFLVKSLKIKN